MPKAHSINDNKCKINCKFSTLIHRSAALGTHLCFPKVAQPQSAATVTRRLMNGCGDSTHIAPAGNGLCVLSVLVTARGRFSLHQTQQLWARITSGKAPQLLLNARKP